MKKIGVVGIILLIGFFFSLVSIVQVFPKLTPQIFALGTGSVTIDALITSIEDVNHNTIMDGGDMVKVSYHITNPTNQDFPFTRIETNLNRDTLNFIHNVQGTGSIVDTGKTITIPNFYLPASQERDISFEARLDYSDGQELTLMTIPEIFTRDNHSLAASGSKTFKITSWFPSGVGSMVHASVKK